MATILANVARNALAFNTIALNPILKIHPSIGIARVGDAPSAFFIGPEIPFAGNTGQDSGAGTTVPPFRDGGGKVKRQAARFRIFLYTGGLPEEVDLDHPDVAEIEWTVHLANRKAAFFEFKGQRGATGPFVGAVPDLRNKSIPAGDRNPKLVIDPGARSIKGASAGPVPFDAARGNFPKDLAGRPVIDFLGELQTDSKGRLLVLGGRGKSVSSDALPPTATQLAALGGGAPVRPGRPPAPILDYANNDTWFDDISDGPVTAKVKLKSGRTVAVQFPAWVLVGPPDFAPDIRSVVSLYDTLLDIAVRDLPTPAAPFYTPLDLLDLQSLKASFRGTPGHQPEFTFDIEPTLAAGLNARFVHDPGPAQRGFHGTLELPALKSPAPTDKAVREVIFNMLRPPAGNRAPQGPFSMPKLYGDNYDVTGDRRQALAITQVQHHILTLWKDGAFQVSGGGGPGPITPEGLDRAALESCVGGAFFPGIECSWLVRDSGLYLEPFRFRHVGATGVPLRIGPLTMGPGFFSQQMALPWQADFLDCAKDNRIFGFFFGWWPAQRPDDVFRTPADAAALTNMVEWDRGVAPTAVPVPPGQSHLNMVQRWNQLGFVISGATAAGKKVFVETERTLP